MHVPHINQKIDFLGNRNMDLVNADGSPRNSKRVTKEGESNKATKKTQMGEGKRSGKSSLSILENNCFGLKAKRKILLQAIKAMRAIKSNKSLQISQFCNHSRKKTSKFSQK